MTETKRKRYKKLLAHYESILDDLMNAQKALLSGGVKSYTIGDRSLTRFDLGTLSDEIEEVSSKIDELENILNGRGARAGVAVVPRDF